MIEHDEESGIYASLLYGAGNVLLLRNAGVSAVQELVDSPFVHLKRSCWQERRGRVSPRVLKLSVRGYKPISLALPSIVA